MLGCSSELSTGSNTLPWVTRHEDGGSPLFPENIGIVIDRATPSVEMCVYLSLERKDRANYSQNTIFLTTVIQLGIC